MSVEVDTQTGADLAEEELNELRKLIIKYKMVEYVKTKIPETSEEKNSGESQENSEDGKKIVKSNLRCMAMRDQDPFEILREVIAENQKLKELEKSAEELAENFYSLGDDYSKEMDRYISESGLKFMAFHKTLKKIMKDHAEKEAKSTAVKPSEAKACVIS
jgi:hypothetical protein